MKAEISLQSQSIMPKNQLTGSRLNSHLGTYLAALLLITHLTACSGMSFRRSTDQKVSLNSSASNSSWVADGAITLARAVPAPQSLTPETMLGFLPGSVPALASPVERTGTWLSVDKNKGSVIIYEGSAEIVNFKAEGIESLPTGIFHVVLKQRNPLWYAPDSYFSARNIITPPAGDKARFRRGALGDFVIFLDKNTPMHSGPMWSSDIGGIRMEENDLSRIYYRLDLGSLVEVK